MKKSDDQYVNLFSHVEKLFGKTPDNKVLASLLAWMGQHKVPEFKEDEWDIYLPMQKFGFCLLFDDAEMVEHDCAKGKPPRTPIFTGCFFYSEGVEGYREYSGQLPYGILWSDSAASLLKTFKEPAVPIRSELNGELQAHVWTFGPTRLTATYRKDQNTLAHLLVGLD